MKIKTLFILLIVLILIKCSQEQSAPQSGGINWLTSMEAGFQKASEENKIIMAEFMAIWCTYCQAMEDSTFSDADVIAKASIFVPVRIDVDEQGNLADQYNANAGKYGGIGIPNILFLDAEGNRLKHVIGYQSPEEILAVMDSVSAIIKVQ